VNLSVPSDQLSAFAVQEINRECIRRERNGTLNWKQKFSTYNGSRREHMVRMKRARPVLDPLKLPPQNFAQTSHGRNEGPPSYRNTARRRLDAATPRGAEPGVHTRVGLSEVADYATHHHVTGQHAAARQLPSREVGSTELWPNRVLKTQNVMEWRNFFNTTNHNNRMHGDYQTTHQADIGSQTQQKYKQQWTPPVGKVMRVVQHDPDNNVHKPTKRCYDVSSPVQACRMLISKSC